MKQLLIFICTFAAGIFCISALLAKPLAKPVSRTNELTLFLTGNELGALQPCGCTGGQLGGLDRRKAVFDSVAVSKRMVIDTGSLIETDSEQNLIKFDIIVQAYNLLGYDVVNLTEKDIEIGRGRGLLDGMGLFYNIISSVTVYDVNIPRKFTKEFALQEKTVFVTIATFDAELSPIDQVDELFADGGSLQTINVLILNNCDEQVISSISEMASDVDCIVCPSETDEPMMISELNERPLVFSVGQFGKYVCKVQAVFASAYEKPNLVFSPVKVVEDLPQDKSLVDLYKDYQQFVKEAKLLEKYPRFTLPDGLKYEGSKSCSKSCHEYEYEKWSEKEHAQAYETLEKVGSQFDPECVICHVVGMDYESGFISEEKSGDDFRDVGCENCHGPGSEHNRTLGRTKTTLPWSDCTDCHTPEHSPDFLDHELVNFEKITHWKEPYAAKSVE